MNRRIRKKKIKQRYIYGLNLLSEYCELPIKIVEKECGSNLWEIATDLNEIYNDLIPYLDCVSIDLMLKYGTGWSGREMKHPITEQEENH